MASARMGQFGPKAWDLWECRFVRPKLDEARAPFCEEEEAGRSGRRVDLIARRPAELVATRPLVRANADGFAVSVAETSTVLTFSTHSSCLSHQSQYILPSPFHKHCRRVIFHRISVCVAYTLCNSRWPSRPCIAADYRLKAMAACCADCPDRVNDDSVMEGVVEQTREGVDKGCSDSHPAKADLVGLSYCFVCTDKVR